MRQTATIIILGLLIVLSGCARTLSDAEIAEMSTFQLMQELRQDRFFSESPGMYPNEAPAREVIIERMVAAGEIDETDAHKLRAQMIWEGMTATHLRIARGRPYNKTVRAHSESWHYGYFPHEFASVYLRREEPGGPLIVRNWSISR